MKQVELNRKITEVMLKMGMQPKYTGYPMMREAIGLAMEYGKYKPQIMVIYGHIAKRYRTSAAAVERNLRQLIHNMMPQPDALLVADHTVSGVIAAAAEYTRLLCEILPPEMPEPYLDNITQQKVFSAQEKNQKNAIENKPNTEIIVKMPAY